MVALGVVEALAGKETVGVEPRDSRAKNGCVQMKLAEGTKHRLSCVYYFTTDDSIFGSFAGDGSVVVDAEDFVPHCVEVGAFGQEKFQVQGTVLIERFLGLEADVSEEGGVVEYMSEDPERYLVCVVIYSVKGSNQCCRIKKSLSSI